MIAILDSVDGYSDRTLAFVEVASEEEARHLLCVAKILFTYPYSKGAAKVLGVADQVAWWTGAPTSVDELLKAHADLDQWESDKLAPLDAVPLEFLERTCARADRSDASDEWTAYMAKRREQGR
jgi:hypothetical protein